MWADWRVNGGRYDREEENRGDYPGKPVQHGGSIV
jgi:hypothetical protein